MIQYKRLIALLLSVLMLTALLPGYAMAEEVVTQEAGYAGQEDPTEAQDSEDWEDPDLTQVQEPEATQAQDSDEADIEDQEDPEAQEPQQEPDEDLQPAGSEQSAEEAQAQQSGDAAEETAEQIIVELPSELVEETVQGERTDAAAEQEEPATQSGEQSEQEEEVSQEPTQAPTQPQTQEPTQTPTQVVVVPVVDLKKAKKQKLTLYYDDRYSFADKWPGYVIYSLKNDRIDSYQVVSGKKSGKKDTAVLKQTGSGGTDVTAVGTGLATVVLIPKQYVGKVNRKPAAAAGVTVREEPVSCIQVTVTVKPARLTLMLLGGQSNMEGRCNGNRSQVSATTSVACKPGTVYSTYVPATTYASTVTGGIGLSPLTSSKSWATTVKAALPASLTAAKTLSGKKLAYPLNALTSEGKGKTGPDAGLAYEWNRLTGDKVWLVNAAWSGSSVSRWVPGQVCYERAKAAFTGAKAIYQAEISAGHYSAGKRLFFWCQGESDRTMSAEIYTKRFLEMYNGLRSACGIQYTGIISVRAANAAAGHITSADLQLNGPRVAQYAMAYDKSLKTIFMVSNANESWDSNAGVRRYFAAAYPGGKLSYPLRSGVKSTLPVTQAEAHPNIHYTQVGHNENGITAARGMYEAIYGASKPTQVTWRIASGRTVQSITLAAGKSVQLLPQVSPISASKQVSFGKSGDQIQYQIATATLTSKIGSFGSLTVTGGGKTLSKLTICSNATPEGITVTNTADGVLVKWSPVGNAERYRVYCKTTGGGWTSVGDTQKTSLLVSKVKGGSVYRFTVRCINARGTVYTSDYDHTGARITYVAAPELKSAKATNGSVNLSWNACAGADSYQVLYRRGSTGGWKNAGVTTDTSFVVGGLDKGSWSFTIRCLSKDKKTAVSGYDATGKTVIVK